MTARTASDSATMRRVTARHPRSSPTDDTFHRPVVSSAILASRQRHVLSGTIWLLALAALMGANAWLIAGCFVPYYDPAAVRPDYLLLLGSAGVFVVAALGSLAVLLVAHFAYLRLARGPAAWKAPLEWEAVSYL